MAFHQPVSFKVVSETVVPAKPRVSQPEGSAPFAGVPMTRPAVQAPTIPVKNWTEEKEESEPRDQKPTPPLKKQQSPIPSLRPEFNPYTLMDAPSTRTHTFMKMGGLGAYMVGSEEWVRKKEQLDRRRQYARQILSSNQTKLLRPKPHRESQSPQTMSTRQRALDFAKNIKPPKIEKKQPSAPVTRYVADPLDELEAEHNRLRGRVEGLKALFK